MKRFVLYVIVFFTAFMSANLNAYAQTLEDYLARLQVTAHGSDAERVLQEQIIALVHDMASPPGTPSAINRFIIRGDMANEMATGPEGYVLAAREFKEATRAAPWVPELYMSLATAQEHAGNYGAAATALELYLLADPDAMDAAIIEDRVVSLIRREYQKELASSQPQPGPRPGPAQTSAPPRAQEETFSQDQLLFYQESPNNPALTNGRNIGLDLQRLTKYPYGGKVLVEYDVNDKGRTSNIRVLKSSHSGLHDQAARTVIKKARFPKGAPQQGVREVVTLCQDSSLIMPTYCDIRFERVNARNGGSPEVQSFAMPVYNTAAVKKSRCATLNVRFDVDNEGKVKNPEIASSSASGMFEINLLPALEKFKFEPGQAATGVEYKVSFSLPGRCTAS